VSHLARPKLIISHSPYALTQMSIKTSHASKFFASPVPKDPQPLKSSIISNTIQPAPLSVMHQAGLKRKREEKPLAAAAVLKVSEGENVVDHSIRTDIPFPLDQASRRAYRTKEGKAVTQHRWDVYDLTCKIPLGTVTTYKHLCDALGSGSPRSVGSALRNNPFAPLVPCHRIIASDHFIGGFCGQWGRLTEDLESNSSNKQSSRKKVKTVSAEDTGKEDLVLKKMTMLAEEGVGFDSNGKVIDAARVIWKPSEQVVND